MINTMIKQRYDSRRLLLALLILATALLTCQTHGQQIVQYSGTAPVIDGRADEQSWQSSQWLAIDQLWLGTRPTKKDFSGQYKLIWDQNKLYLLAQITDDVLSDQHPDPLQQYWNDDCLEVFIDADASGGDHLHNHNAFAYHVALDNQVVDIDSDGKAYLFSHIESQWQRDSQHRLIWELAISVYPDSFIRSDVSTHKPLPLTNDMKLGFMLGYCDSDGTSERQHFIGSQVIQAVNGDRNLGYRDASVFGPIILKGSVD